MDENRFWDIVDFASAAANGSRARHLEELESLLTSFSPDDEWKDDPETLSRLYPRLSAKYP